MSDTNWHYAQGRQTYGPINIAALRELCSRGAVQRSTLVWTDEMTEWAPAETVPRLWVNPVMVASPGVAVVNYQSPVAAERRYAGFWVRLLAHVIDWIVTVVLGMVIGGVFGFFVGVIGAANGRHGLAGNSPEKLAQLLGLLASWLYYALMESSPRQATLGKLAIGLYVTDLAGERVSFGRATGRYFAKILSVLIVFIGFIMVGFTEKKQGLHDIIAGTLVLRRR